MAGRILRCSMTESGAVRLSVREEHFEGDSRRTYTLSSEDHERLGAPQAGEEADDELLSSLAEAEGRLKATERAVSLLSYGDNSARALCRKLRSRGYDRESAEAAVANMMQKGYIRENEQARRLAVSCATRKLWGRRRIVAYLTEKGYDLSLARQAIEEAEQDGEIDFEKTKKELLSRKLEDEATYEEKRRLLYRYGY
ncbi:MAG: RecX family transcriptional regulator [Clostridia bacterium]|nr:RecX family transcriptional regulator [Clostridia bacterium]